MALYNLLVAPNASEEYSATFFRVKFIIVIVILFDIG
jgi:hypothetical protein